MKGKVRKATQEFLDATKKAEFTLRELETEFRYVVLRQRLQQFDGNQVKTARSLGIHRNRLAIIVNELEQQGKSFTIRRRGRSLVPAPAIHSSTSRSVGANA